MNKIAVAVAFTLVGSSLWAIQGTIKTATDTKTGEIKWQPRTKSYALVQKNVNLEYPLKDVVSLDVEKPSAYDKAVEAVRSGNGAAAIGPLTKIVQDYRMLVWDKPAGRYLVEAYLASDQFQKAYETAVGIISDDKSAGWKSELAPAYWQAMLKLGKIQQLEPLLKKAASSGDRASSAAALVMRGDLILNTEGESPEVLRKALTDAYLRVVFMYTDDPCRDARIDAMLKAANCLDKLDDASRAEQLRLDARKI